MRLLVVTATRGDSPYLASAVESVAGLGLGARHVIVCPEPLRARYELEFPACSLVADTGRGLYEALNLGLGAAGRHDCFTWINDDDLLTRDGFRSALQQLAADPSLGAVYGRVGLVDSGARSLGEIPVAHRPADLPALLASGIMPLAQPGTLCRWGVLDQIGNFATSYQLAGDLDFFVRALHAGVRFGFCNEKVACFRLHAGQLSKNEALAATEHARAIEILPPVSGGGARRRFRWDNLPVYWARFRQHGFKRMQEIYRHE